MGPVTAAPASDDDALSAAAAVLRRWKTSPRTSATCGQAKRGRGHLTSRYRSIPAATQWEHTSGDTMETRRVIGVQWVRSGC